VFERDGRLHRALSATALADWERLAATRFYRELSDQGSLPRTSRVSFDETELRSLSPRFEAVLEHERLPLVSYPYEWSFSMLRDAALLTLDILAAAIGEGMTLKDASAYNVAFRGAQPVFVDLGSFETWRQGEPWVGYRQFCQLFLYPLFLHAYKGIPFQAWLRGSIDGILPEDMAGLFSAREWLRAGVFTHVVLQAMLVRRAAATRSSMRESIAAAGFKKEMILANVASIRRVVARLQPRRATSTWSEYATTRSYGEADLRTKQEFVRRAIRTTAPRVIWDLGCNTGEFSRIAAETAEYVVAIDGDELAVDRLYTALAQERNTRIQPLVVRFNDPSPGLGWRNEERGPLEQRSRPDLVLALALAHHLVITANVPVAAVLSWLADTAPCFVVEFVSKQDPMVKQLLLNKIDDYVDWEKPRFEAELEARGEIVDRLELSSGTRFLYLARRRGVPGELARGGSTENPTP
jgi:SAM-dependent methyltransferase